MSLMNMLGVITHPLPGRRGGNTGNTIKPPSPAPRHSPGIMHFVHTVLLLLFSPTVNKLSESH